MNTSSSPIDVVADYFAALAAGRVEDALAAFSAEVAWHQPGENRFSGVHNGPAAVGALLAGMMQVSGGSFSVEPTGPLMVNGELVVAPVRFTGGRDGLALDQSGVDLLTVRDGRIVEVRLFSSDPGQEDAFWGEG